jgi:Fe-S cluster assembly protein SufD
VKHFEEAFARLPEPQRRERAPLFEAFRAKGLPTKKQEDWKYTDLSGLAERRYELAEAALATLPSLEGADTVAFVNGQPKKGSDPISAEKGSDPISPKNGSDPFSLDGVTALNAVFATAGLDLAVPADGKCRPLHLVTWFGGADQRMAHLRHRIRLARGAEATVVLHEVGDSAAFFATQVLDIELGENARLQLYRVQQFGRGTSALTRLDARLSRNARFSSVSFHGGGALVRNDVNVSLDAPDAEAELHGVIAPAAGEHLDVHTRLDHRAPHGRSRESFRVLVPEKGRAVFNGKVIVHPDAQKTDSEQHVDSLLLAPGAEVNAKPELEIYADDVKCAHGATCGQLDEQAIYYLRSRGLARETARDLLLFTFARQILQGIAFEPARKLAEQALRRRLPWAPALEELL